MAVPSPLIVCSTPRQASRDGLWHAIRACRLILPLLAGAKPSELATGLSAGYCARIRDGKRASLGGISNSLD
jgi:hypothetical protein